MSDLPRGSKVLDDPVAHLPPVRQDVSWRSTRVVLPGLPGREDERAKQGTQAQRDKAPTREHRQL